MNPAMQRSMGAGVAEQVAAEAATLRWRLAADLAARAVFAALSTSHGSLHFELFPSRAPNAVANFVGLATGVLPYMDWNAGEMRTGRYFNGLRVGRIVRGMLLQFGDETDTAAKGLGYTFNDEYSADLTFNRPYLVAMANGGKRADGSGTNSSHFFVTLSPASHLNFAKPIFGELADDHSRRLVDELSTVATDGRGRPVDPIVIQRVDVVLDNRVEG
jgi:peptidyl-prolyl cis-trans isomerase A (cyclophilin A)